MTTTDPQRSVIRFNKYTLPGWHTRRGNSNKQRKPRRCQKMGDTRKISLRKDWENVKEQVMTEALFAKFIQHASLGQVCLFIDSLSGMYH